MLRAFCSSQYNFHLDFNRIRFFHRCKSILEVISFLVKLCVCVWTFIVSHNIVLVQSCMEIPFQTKTFRNNYMRYLNFMGLTPTHTLNWRLMILVSLATDSRTAHKFRQEKCSFIENGCRHCYGSFSLFSFTLKCHIIQLN